MNVELAVQVAQEFVMPAYMQQGGCAVVFYRRTDKQHSSEVRFNLPMDNEEQCNQTTIALQELFVQAIQRYEEIVTGRMQLTAQLVTK